MSKTATVLDYDDGKTYLPEEAFRISPSSFNRFISQPHTWFAEQVLGEGTFEGSTSTVIGTIVHYVAEAVANGEHPSKKEILQYMDNHADVEDVDIDTVIKDYPIMAETLVNDYVLQNIPTKAEDFVKYHLGGGVWVAGTVDAYDNGTIVDYKTYNSKSKPRSIPMHYKYQLLIYAYIYSKLGYEADRIRLVYINRPIDGGISEKTGKPLKSYPPEVTVLNEEITKEDLQFIESVLFLCRDTYLKAKEDESLVYLLYKDYRLKDFKWHQ